jgi:opacity protein-like surface antigen
MLVVVSLLFVAAIATAADNVPKVELFGGYSFLHCSTGDSDANCNLNGWNASAAFNVNSSFGIVADFSGLYGTITYDGSSYKDTARAHAFLFGPKVAMRKGKITPFAQALFGQMQGKTFSSTSDGSSATAYNQFAMALGGGLDINASEKIAIRVAQAEFITTTDGYDGYAMNHFRYSAGVVFKLGK